MKAMSSVIIAATNALPYGIPPKNIIAMYMG
jgi:hypothetical protein